MPDVDLSSPVPRASKQASIKQTDQEQVRWRIVEEEENELSARRPV
jgi:hypothetical protein